MIGYHPSKKVDFFTARRSIRAAHMTLMAIVVLLIAMPAMAQEEPQAEATSTPLDWSLDPVFE